MFTSIKFLIKKNYILRYAFISAIIFSPSLFFHSKQVILLYPVEIFFYMFVLNALENFNRKIYFILNVLLISISLFFTSYGIIFGTEIGPQVLASVLETNPKEALEFSSSILFKKFILIYILIWIIGVYLLSIKTDTKFQLYKHKNILISFIPFFLIFSFHTYKGYHYYPEIIIKEGYKYFINVKAGDEKYKKLKYSFNGEVNKTKESNFILIIGEASRRASYGLYGYEIDTTPLLSSSKKNFILFNNAISAACVTRVSVPSLLSISPVKEWNNVYNYPSIIKILNSQNFYTTTISNQTVHSVNDIFINTILRESNNTIFLEELNNNYFDTNFYDKDLLPYLNTIIEKQTKLNNFIVLHLAGSHFRYDYRYPKEETYFKNDSNIDKYNNSIRHTDFVLNQIKKRIEKTQEPYAVLYTSDHGECLSDYGSGLYGHSMTKRPTKFEVEIPFIFFYNSAFEKIHQEGMKLLKKHMNSKISLDNISHTILDLLGVYPKKYDENYALSSDNFKENERFIKLDGYDDSIKFSELKLRKSSKEMSLINLDDMPR